MRRAWIPLMLVLMLVPGCSKSQLGDLATWAAKKAVLFLVHRLADSVEEDRSSEDRVDQATSPESPAASSAESGARQDPALRTLGSASEDGSIPDSIRATRY